MNAASHVDSPGIPVADRCLHLLMSESETALEQCTECCRPGDAVVLMNTAVTRLALPAGAAGVASLGRVYCLDADLCAHGLDRLAEELGFQRLDDHGLVGLVTQHRLCLSWK